MKALKIIAAAALACLLAAACKKKEIPVTQIEISPSEMELLVGETQPLTVTCKPDNATNLDQLKITCSNGTVIGYHDGVVGAYAAGTSTVRATCGKASASCLVRVCNGRFYKGDEVFGADEVSGYYFYESEPTVQSMEITLTRRGAGPYEGEHLQMYIRYDQAGKLLDFTRPLEGGPFVSPYTNNNENGYVIFASEDGHPMIRRADWSDAGDVTLEKGELQIDDLGNRHYRIHMDFVLSNGYRFGTDWDGYAYLTVEGKP